MEIITALVAGTIGIAAGYATGRYRRPHPAVVMSQQLANDMAKLRTKREAVPEGIAPVAFTAHPGMTAAARAAKREAAIVARGAPTTPIDQAQPFTREEVQAIRDKRNATYAAQRAASRVNMPQGSDAA